MLSTGTELIEAAWQNSFEVRNLPTAPALVVLLAEFSNPYQHIYRADKTVLCQDFTLTVATLTCSFWRFIVGAALRIRASGRGRHRSLLNRYLGNLCRIHA